MSLGDRIKQMRNRKGLTQEELAKRLRDKHSLKTDRVMISKWESDFQQPQIQALRCLAIELDTSLDYLNDTENISPPEPDDRMRLNADGRYLLDKIYKADADELKTLRQLADIAINEDAD